MKMKCKLPLSNGHNTVFNYYYFLLLSWGCAYGCYIQKYKMENENKNRNRRFGIHFSGVFKSLVFRNYFYAIGDKNASYISGSGENIAILCSSIVGTGSLTGKVFLTSRITWQASKYERQSVMVWATQK